MRSTKETINEDVSERTSSASLWNLEDECPQIRQIFGHFLPPHHMQMVEGLVAKDFNFPAAYHRAAIACTLAKLHALGAELSEDTVVTVDSAIEVRKETGGAVLYTPYHNGFFVNSIGHQILEKCRTAVPVRSIVEQLSLECSQVIEFLARALTIGLVQVHEA